jgi:hypothetical protein
VIIVLKTEYGHKIRKLKAENEYLKDLMSEKETSKDKNDFIPRQSDWLSPDNGHTRSHSNSSDATLFKC